MLSNRILDSVEAYFALSPQMLALSVELPRPVAGRPAGRLSLAAARELVLDSAASAEDRDAVWAQVVRFAAAKEEPWDLAAIWMMVPGLRKACRRCRRCDALLDIAELEAEAVAGFLEALQVADPQRPELGSWLWWTTYRHVQRQISLQRQDMPTADIELVSRLEANGYDEGRSDPPGHRLTSHAVPVVEAATVPNHTTVEGERLGALIHRFGFRQRSRGAAGCEEDAA